MTKNHNFYLDLAYQLAEKNLGKTGLNPSVGTIIVKNKEDNSKIEKEVQKEIIQLCSSFPIYNN